MPPRFPFLCASVSRHALRGATAFALPLAGMMAPAQAQTAGGPVSVSIAPGPLSAAVSAYAAKAGVLLSFDPALTRDLQSPGLNGTYVFEDGLRQLLAGSGLEPARRADGGYTLRRLPQGEITALPAVTVTGARDSEPPSEGSGSYTVPATSAATRMPLSLRETPQSVSVVTRQQMDDQNLNTLDEVLRQTPGIVSDRLDERVTFTSRGFALSTMIDGVPTFSFKTPSAEAGMVNTALYDRVEVIRGAAGLLNGVGEPGGSVNLVRKRPTSEFAGHVTGGVGRWNSYNAEVDLGGPLNSAGTLRGRVVAARTAGDTFIDYKKRSDDVFYGILEADLTPDTTLSFGYEHQKTAIDGANFGQAPLFYSDGTRTDFPRSFNPGTPWSQWDMYTDKIFVTLDHRLASGWRVKMDASRLKNERRATWGYLFEYFPVEPSGDSTIEIRDNPATSTNKSFDIYAEGPFHAFGREHRASLGVSYNNYRSELNLNSANPAGWDRRPLNFYELQNFPKPTTFHTYFNTFLDAKETAVYGSTRLKVADPVSVILGARTTWYEEKSSSYNGPADTWTTNPTAKANGVFTPYAGVVVDVTKDFSAYGSYTRIFIPTSSRDANNAVLPPQTGQNYELGLKGEHLDGRLNSSFAIFRTQEENVAVEDPTGLPLPDGSTPYRSVKGARSKGFELTLSGEVARDLQLMGGYTYFAKRDAEGALLLPSTPERLFRLAASYRLPGAWNKLTVGGNVSYQSSVYYDEAGGLGRASQGGVTLFGLMARYEFNQHVAASVNVENLTDKHYYSGLGGYNGYNYGTPRNVWMKVSYKF
ncbi:TonB-dependent siderophore receptor [Achromobacter marplatensis]|uniref:TonB-dependent receptor n=1 Tax=Achromobacter marplatensis TaxID=470868 RepID=A0AA42W5Y7_9BURK|nr:TonB-dependent siderophore receptor [Achromobacter marplatensis]MDH2049245.1 TonB-dependent receptor [Achromobacter marplatensis]